MRVRALPDPEGRKDVHTIELSAPVGWKGLTATGRVWVRTVPAGPRPLWIPYRVSVEAAVQVRPRTLRFGRLRSSARPTRTVLIAAPDGSPLGVTGVEVVPAGVVEVGVHPAAAGWKLTVTPGTGWPASGRVAATLRVQTDRVAEPIEVKIEGYVLGD